jgi:hypothetical protein
MQCVLKAQGAVEVQFHAVLNFVLDVCAYMTSCRGHFNCGKGLPVPNGQKARWTPKTGTQSCPESSHDFSVAQPENWSLTSR